MKGQKGHGTEIIRIESVCMYVCVYEHKCVHVYICISI